MALPSKRGSSDGPSKGLGARRERPEEGGARRVERRSDDPEEFLDEVEEIEERRVPQEPVKSNELEDESWAEEDYTVDDEDESDDDTFTTVDEDEEWDEEDEDDDDYDDEEEDEDDRYSVPDPEPVRRKRASEISFGNKKSIEEKKKEKEAKRERAKRHLEEEISFIDEEKLELKPFGSGSRIETVANRRIKVGNFDGRNNRQNQKRIVQYATMGLIGIIALASLANVLIPEDNMTPEEVQSVALEAVGESGFPVEEGGAFAQDFMRSYLNINRSDPKSEQILGYFYGNDLSGEGSGSAPAVNRSASGTYGQSIVFGPTIYSSRGINETSANYVIGALVQPRFEAEVDPDTGEPTEEQPGAQWMFFNVNVYHNADNNSFSIVNDSPTIVPNLNTASPAEVPEEESLGTEITDEATLSQVDPTITGFMRAYATSTSDETSSLEQYLSSEPDPSARGGLGGQYQMLDEDNPFEYTVYSDPDVAGVLKVDLKVDWVSSVNEDNGATFTSNYVLTLEQGADGRYYVYRIAPKYYVEGTQEEG